MIDAQTSAVEMVTLVRNHDWAPTTLGLTEDWPQSLRTAVNLALRCTFPMAVLWGPDLIQIYNDGYRVILGDKHPGGLGQPARDCWPEVWDINKPIYDRVLAGETMTLGDVFYPISRNGILVDAWFTICYSPLLEESGSVAGVLVTLFEITGEHRARVERAAGERVLRAREQEMRDILESVTERKETEEALRRVGGELEVRVAERTAQLAASVEEVRTREGHLRLLLQQMPAMLWTTDRAMHVTTLAGASVPIWHTAPMPFEGRPIVDLFADTDLDGKAEVIHQGVLEGKSAEFEFQVGSHTYEAHVEPLRDAGGDMIGTIGVAHDVTDRTLRKLQEDFIASVSHELQTPLTSIRAGLGLLELAIGETLEPAERELLSASRRNAERLRLQIAQLLAANQVMAGEQVEVEFSAIDLRPVVDGAVDAVRPLLQEKEQIVDVDMPDSLEVEGDRRLMQQVLANLLSNAYRHTPRGTRIAVSSWVVGDQVRLAVHDAGPGIPADQLETIFQRFYRAPGVQREGVGLGLAMARGAVEVQGGRLWAESSPGYGTTFIVSLPRVPEAERR